MPGLGAEPQRPGRPAAARRRQVAVGQQADLALFTLDDLRFSGSHDPLSALLLCGADRADRVMVAGQWRVVDGAVVGLDLPRLITAHRAAAARLVGSAR